MAAADFEIGDLVWAKMKSYPFWPGEISQPPQNAKSSLSRKSQHYVFFFGTENCAWISDTNIIHHSEEMLQSTSTKKKSTSLKSAIEKIVAESEKVPMKSRPPPKEKDQSELNAEASPVSSSEKKVSKSKKGKSKYESAKKKYFATVQKTSQNKYSSKMQKKVRKKYFGDKKTSVLKETSSVEKEENIFAKYVKWHAAELLLPPGRKRVGFIGLGKIGKQLVRKLIETDHYVTLWNRSIDKCLEFVRIGARRVLYPSDVIAMCDVTFCCVSGVDAVKAIVFGPKGILKGFKGTSGKGYIELTTIDSKTSEEIAEAIEQEGGVYLESPVSESKKPNAPGSFIVICAGDYDLFRKCESCFMAFTSDAFYLSGVVGLGASMNLLTNMFMNTAYASLAESLALTQKLKLSQEVLLECLKDGPINSSLLLNKGKAIASGDFFNRSSSKHLQKNLSLALSMGDSCVQPLSLAAAANEFYKRPNDILYEPNYATSSTDDSSSAED